MTCTPPVIDIDGSMWSVFVRDQGPDASVAIQVCEGFDYNENRSPAARIHQFDGDFHEGDLHLFLDNDAAARLLTQLGWAFSEKAAESEPPSAEQPLTAGLRVVDREQ
jgi:hypothetical protein